MEASTETDSKYYDGQFRFKVGNLQERKIFTPKTDDFRNWYNEYRSMKKVRVVGKSILFMDFNNYFAGYLWGELIKRLLSEYLCYLLITLNEKKSSVAIKQNNERN